MSRDQYLRELAYRLRWRHVGEARVRDELLRVLDFADGTDLAARFGSPAEYAREIQRGKSVSRGYLVASGLAAVAIVVVLARVILGLVLGQEQNAMVSVAVYAGALAWMVASAVIGARIDSKLPTELS